MKKFVLILGAVLGIALFLFAFTMDTESTEGNPGCEKKVTICHRPPGNPENAQTITVGASGAEAHLREHCEDTPCECPPPPCH